MALRGGRSASKPITFKPRGVSDTVDGTNAPQGAMIQLSNMLPSPSTESLFVCRPAAAQLTNFTGFTTPTSGTALLVSGTLAYGMISSADFAGKDEPFCYDIANGAFIAIAGPALGNLPTTQPTTGDWTPPTMVMVNKTIIVTHPGFAGGAGNYFGRIDVTNPAAPVWSAGNTVGNALAAVPKACYPFNGRAWYAVNNSLVFSDALVPLTVTNATQVIILGDDTAVTALGGLGLNSTTQGGIVQSLIAFKSTEAVFQITGDSATSNLLSNILQGVVGTLAPNTVTPLPLGLAFVAPDGLRILDMQAHCSDPIGAHGQGVSVPLIYALNPSRMCAAYQHNILRIACQNGNSPTQAYQEWWFDFTSKIWTGPHTFCGSAASIISGYDGPPGTDFAGHDFLAFATGVNGKLWSSSAVPLLNSTYTENGVALNSAWQTMLLPDNQEMAENAIVESAIGLVLPATVQCTVTMQDEAGNVLDTATLTGPGAGPTIWNAFVWGAAPWGALGGYFQQYQLNWTTPIVFKQASVLVAVASGANIAIGNLYLRYQVLGYLLMRSG